MAQGTLKKSKVGVPKASSTKRSQQAKKGQRAIAPRKKALLAHHKISKKYSANQVQRTEKNLAEKAGHLELLRGGKNDKAGAKGVKGK